MKTLRRLFILTGFLGRVFFFGVLAADAYFFTPNARTRRLRLTQNAARFARSLCQLFGMEVEVLDPSYRPYLPRQPRFIVANHLSTLDILALLTEGPAVFITSTEIESAPVIGHLAQLAGATFVNRKNFFNLPAEIDEVTRLFKQGNTIVLFAEATSGNGEALLPFKNAFFTVPLQAGARVQPVCINYQGVNQEPVTPANRDRLFYYGDMGFWGHLWRLCGIRSINIHCEFLTPIAPLPGSNRKLLSYHTREAIAARFHPIRRTPLMPKRRRALPTEARYSVTALSR